MRWPVITIEVPGRSKGEQQRVAITTRDGRRIANDAGMILAIDIGAQCGWATGPDPLRWGSINLGSRLKPKFAGHARDGRLNAALYAFITNWKPTEIIYESNRVARGGAPIAAFGALRGTIQLVGEHIGVTYHGVPMKTPRKWLTGNGNANKDEVWNALAERGHLCTTIIPPIEPDYDASDALAVLLWRLESQG